MTAKQRRLLRHAFWGALFLLLLAMNADIALHGGLHPSEVITDNR